jgi:thiol-disulfide isomerase/thioredoxin
MKMMHLAFSLLMGIGLLWNITGCASLSTGDPAPAWSALDLADREHTLADYAGQVVILDFWATWCAPCHPVSAFLQTLQDDYHDRGLQILAFHYNTTGDPAAYAHEKGYTFTIFPDGHQVAKLYGVSKIPTLIVVDKAGTIIHRQTGFETDDAENLRDIVQAAL